MKWTLQGLLLFLMLALSGCSTNRFCVLPEPMCQAAPPFVNMTQFLGVWVNEDPQPNQLTRLEVGEKEPDWPYMHMWLQCGSQECEYEGTINRYVRDGRKVLDIDGWPSNERGEVWLVQVSLAEPINNRIRAEVALRIGDDDSPPPDVYYFIKQQP